MISTKMEFRVTIQKKNLHKYILDKWIKNKQVLLELLSLETHWQIASVDSYIKSLSTLRNLLFQQINQKTVHILNGQRKLNF